MLKSQRDSTVSQYKKFNWLGDVLRALAILTFVEFLTGNPFSVLTIVEIERLANFAKRPTLMPFSILISFNVLMSNAFTRHLPPIISLSTSRVLKKALQVAD
jgi:hypothetical protein